MIPFLKRMYQVAVVAGIVLAIFLYSYGFNNFSETELVELTDAVITIRESMQTMRAMERTGENVEVLKETRDRRDQAILDFERITGMNALEFMLRAPAEGGIDRD